MSVGMVSEFAVREWIKAFKRAPILTAIGSIFLSAAISIMIYFIDQKDREKRESVRAKSISYVEQINKLNQTENNVRELLQFVDLQKENLRQNQDVLVALKAEHEKLKPIVEADKRLVSAVLQAQDERALSNIWKERGIGFVFGLVASILASVIVGISKTLLSKSFAQKE